MPSHVSHGFTPNFQYRRCGRGTPITERSLRRSQSGQRKGRLVLFRASFVLPDDSLVAMRRFLSPEPAEIRVEMGEFVG